MINRYYTEDPGHSKNWKQNYQTTKGSARNKYNMQEDRKERKKWLKIKNETNRQF